MAIPVIMPKQGQSVETCIITTWLKKKGEQVRQGDILFSYETDKAAFDMESPADGHLLNILYDEGAEVPVLVTVAVIGSAGEDTTGFLTAGGSEDVSKVSDHFLSQQGRDSESVEISKSPLGDLGVVKSKQHSNTTIQRPGDLPGGKIRISPRARRIAGEKGFDFSNLTGSGPNGRIVVTDIELALKAGISNPGKPLTPDSGYSDMPLSNVRKMIARAMHASIQNSAQLTHHMSADARNLLEARKTIKMEMSSGRQDITMNDMICWCVIKALKKFQVINTHFLDDRIRAFNNVHLGIAVDTPRGLMVPVVKSADSLDLGKLSKQLKEVAEGCRKGNINPELLQSNAASFTISNLGAYGVEMFTPVLNLPQTGILGVCTIVHRPADLGNGVFGFIPVIGLSLTYDHRAVDGGPATLFLKEIKDEIEKFRLP